MSAATTLMNHSQRGLESCPRVSRLARSHQVKVCFTAGGWVVEEEEEEEGAEAF